MKKILLSIATLGVAGAVVIGGTTAIFSDSEVSTGNTFTAGAIDLQIDNRTRNRLPHDQSVLGLAALDYSQRNRSIDVIARQNTLERERHFHRAGNPDDFADLTVQRRSLIGRELEHSSNLFLVE